MSVEAVFVIVFVGGKRSTTAQVKLLADVGKRPADRPRTGKRAVVSAIVVLFQSCQSEAGYRVVEVNLEQQESFVVSKADIIARFEFLNKSAFEEQGVGIAFNLVSVKIVDCVNQGE